MMQIYTETDYKEILSLPSKLMFRPTGAINETTTGQVSDYFFSVPDETSLIKRAWEAIYNTVNKNVARESRKLLSIIQETINFFPDLGFDLSYLPELYAFNVDDGSVLIEWIFTDFRIGFSIEPDSKESNWYLVSNQNLGEINASGYISSKDPRGLVLWMLTFIFVFSFSLIIPLLQIK